MAAVSYAGSESFELRDQGYMTPFPAVLRDSSHGGFFNSYSDQFGVLGSMQDLQGLNHGTYTPQGYNQEGGYATFEFQGIPDEPNNAYQMSGPIAGNSRSYGLSELQAEVDQIPFNQRSPPFIEDMNCPDYDSSSPSPSSSSSTSPPPVAETSAGNRGARSARKPRKPTKKEIEKENEREVERLVKENGIVKSKGDRLQKYVNYMKQRFRGNPCLTLTLTSNDGV